METPWRVATEFHCPVLERGGDSHWDKKSTGDSGAFPLPAKAQFTQPESSSFLSTEGPR